MTDPNPRFIGPALGLLLLYVLPATASAQGLWDLVKEGAAKTYEHGGDLMKGGAQAGTAAGGSLAEKTMAQGKALADDTVGHFYRSGTPDEIRARVDAMAADTLEQLLKDQPDAGRLLDQAYGYAVFAVRQAAAALTAGYGYGVAVGGEGPERIYMKAATAGVEIGKGSAGFKSHWVAVFADAHAFRVFVEQGLDASAEASGVAGGLHAGIETRARKGVNFYRVTDGGLKIAATLSGTRFWRDSALNPPPQSALPAEVLDLNPPPRHAMPAAAVAAEAPAAPDPVSQAAEPVTEPTAEAAPGPAAQ